MLKSFENRFLNLESKTKIQLYLLPLLILYFILYFLPKNDNQVINPQKTKKEIIYKDSYLVLFSDIERVAKVNKLDVLTLKRKDKSVNVILKGSNKNFTKFIFEIENLNNFTNLIKVKSEKIEKSFIHEIIISFDKYFAKSLKQIKKEENQKDDFKLIAIIDNYVLIDEEILKLNQFYKNYKVIEINEKNVILQNKDKFVKLELKDEKFAKYLD